MPKIKASSARAHTRKSQGLASTQVAGFSRILVGLMVFSASFAIVSWMAYRHIQPPAPKICGTPNGPPVTAPRVQLRDGRFLAYMEAGIQKSGAKYKIIAVHGYGGSRHALLGGLSEKLMVELRIYVVGFDRAGYGQSTPNPSRNIKSDAFDVQDLADGLDLGPTFYVACTSIGGYTGYGLIKYLPNRLAGVAFFAPVINFWWTGFPPVKVDTEFGKQGIGDRMALSVAHHFPKLVHWYMTQRVFPTSTTVKGEYLPEASQQGQDESMFRDMKLMFGEWEFEPFELENPFATREGSVHIWQGDADYLVPAALQREVANALPWVQYHEIPEAGHPLLAIPGQADKMIRSLVTS